jgi:DNA-binding NtrC family response regulator
MQGQTLKVLVSDDDNYWRNTVFPALMEKHATSISAAANLKTTIEQLDRHVFHVVIVDICLDPDDDGNRDGLETLKRIRSLREGTRALVLTGHGSASLARDALVELGATDVLEKATLAEEAFLELLTRHGRAADVWLMTY